MKDCIKSILIFCLLVGFSSERVCALDFIPKIYDYSGELELDMRYELNDNRTNGRGIKTTDTVLRERLRLSLDGFLYHPRFVTFSLKGAGGLQHERFSLDGDSDWDNESSNEYDVRFFVLPKHSYNLELFTSRYAPLLRGKFAGPLSPVKLQSGIYLRYKRRPWAALASYVHDRNKGVSLTTDTDTYTVNARFSKRFFGLTGGYNHSDTESTGFAELEKDFYYGENMIKYKFAKLDSKWSRDDEQESGTRFESRDLERTLWTETLSLDLPWNFKSIIAYGESREERTSRLTTFSPKTETFNDTDKFDFHLNHRLYKSVTSTYHGNFLNSDSSGGDYDLTTHNFVAHYDKKIPRGHISAGFTYLYNDYKREDAPLVITEPHSSQILGEFLLNNRDIDKPTIELTVKDPNTGFFVLLTENVHYLVIPLNNRIRIRILSVPATVLQPDPTFLYEFRATYSIITGEIEIETRTIGYSLRLNLLDNLLSPYYLHNSTRQDVINGHFRDDDRKRDTVGLTVQKFSFSITGEYERITSDIDPTKKWLLVADYTKKFSPYTDFYAKLKYEKTEYLEGQSVSEDKGHTDRIYSADIKFIAKIPRQNIDFSFAGGYYRREDFIDNSFLSANSLFVWHKGKLDVTLGGTYSYSTTDLSTGDTDQETVFVWLNVKRKLF